MMEHYGVASTEEVMVDNLADRLRVEMTAAGSEQRKIGMTRV